MLACALVMAAVLTSCGNDPVSLEEYASWCSESSLLAVTAPQSRQGPAPRFRDLEETAAAVEALVANYESIDPPAEVAGLHDQTLEELRAAAAAIDELPSIDDVSSGEDFLKLVESQSDLEHVLWDVTEDFEGASGGLVLPPAVRESLTAGGCLALLQPTGARYAPAGSAVVISWEPAPGADSYTVYYDDFSGNAGCQVDSGGDAAFCHELAAEVLITRFVDAQPAPGDNHYWVSACNRWHCTSIDGESAAGPVDEPPPAAAPVAPEPPPTTTTTATPTEISRADFEASAPEGYTAVTVGEAGPVWGTPDHYTSDSSPGAVAYLLLGTAAGCGVADAQAAGGATAYIRTAALGDLPSFESTTVCAGSSNMWDSGWDGLRITHLRVFDDASPTNVTEYVYDDESGLYVGTSPAPAARRTAMSPGIGTQEECSQRWARQPELSFDEAISMCGGDVDALRAEHVEACATSDAADAGLGWRTYADFARDSEIEATARAGAAGDEDEAVYYEALADRYAEEASHAKSLATEATTAETDRRARIIAERGVASWPEACQQMTDELWQLDFYGVAEVGDDLAAHFVELADVVCGGYHADLGDLCGGIDLLELGVDALVATAEALGLGLEAFGTGLEALGTALEGFGAALEGIFSIFG